MAITTTNLSRIRTALWVLVGIAFVALVWFAVISPRLAMMENSDLGAGSYQLQTTDGRTFTSQTLQGEPTAVFFGFTHCPDVCPTTLGDVATWQEELAEDGKDLRVFFVTVDPERDQMDTLRDYVSWVPGVTGVTGTPEEVAKAIRSFRIYAAKVQTKDGYTMDHSTMMLLFDESGEYTGLIRYQEEHDKAMESLRGLLG